MLASLPPFVIFKLRARAVKLNAQRSSQIEVSFSLMMNRARFAGRESYVATRLSSPTLSKSTALGGWPLGLLVWRFRKSASLLPQLLHADF
jgi:hypothetical protein